MDNITKKYSNEEVTIVWKPDLCIHSGKCFRGLGEVFDPRKRPWITPEHSTTDKIIDQVQKCPSGALSHYLNKNEIEKPVRIEAETIIEASENGPLLIYGNVTIKDGQNNLTRKNNVTALCRCGGSQNKPYCDGSHKKNGFIG
jgi:uncharacterized Fe-S cluster protein YjdI